MNKELKEKWVAALRSGKYEQGTGALRSVDNRYCCLGVLCEVMGIEAEQSHKSLPYRYDGSIACLSNTIASRAGLSGLFARLKVPFTYKNEDYTDLAALNDKTDIGFEGIANIIEEQF